MEKTTDPQVRIQPDIVFAVRDGAALAGDLYLPAEAPSPVPVLIFIHGGGWQGGDKRSAQHWGRFLGERGVAVFSATYRLAKVGRGAYPEALEDVKAAIQFVRDGKLNPAVDPARVGLVGSSAGAHLAALAALTMNFASVDGDALRLVVCAYGVYDMIKQWEFEASHQPPNNFVETFLGAKPANVPRLYGEASPMTYVPRTRIRTPFLLTFGLRDDVVLHQQSETFHDALERESVPVQTFVVPEAGHFWMSDPLDAPNSFSGHFAPTLLQFLSERLGAA